jgi:hypothetical protein
MAYMGLLKIAMAYEGLPLNCCIYIAILDVRGTGIELMVFPEFDSSTITHTPLVSHLSSLNYPHHPFPNGGCTPIIYTKKMLGLLGLYFVSIMSLQTSW